MLSTGRARLGLACGVLGATLAPLLGPPLAAGHARASCAPHGACPRAHARLSAAVPTVARSIAAGAYTAYAVTSGGQVWAWGDGMEGQLGDGAVYQSSDVPVRVGTLSGVSEVAASDNTAYAVLHGRVWSWGDGSQGQDGNGKVTYFQDHPEPVQNLSGAMRLAAGGYSAYILTTGSKVWALGDNSSGQLGLSLSVASSDVPVRVTLRGAGELQSLAAGTSSAYALSRNGTVWAWGDDAFGELGRSARLGASTVPVRARGVDRAAAVAANGFTAIALLRNGTVWAWGDGSFGELGPTGCSTRPAGTPKLGKGARTGPQPTRQQARTCTFEPTPTRVGGLSGVKSVAAGGEAAYALGANGTVWAWGNNAYGQLGDGTTTSSSRPVRVARLRNVIALAAGGTSAYALEAGGTIWAWGNNAYGQLGDGTTTSSDLPVRVKL
jgi:alpha-tubulin suppressor-like RCC1 family protein